MLRRVVMEAKFLDDNKAKILFLSGKNSPSTHSSANGQILTRTFERKWLPNDRAIELLIRDWKLGTLNLAKIGTKISKRD